MGAGLLFVVFFIVAKKRGKKHEEELTRLATEYEQGLFAMKKTHIREIHLAEEKVKEFRKKLSLAEIDYQKSAEMLKHKHEQKIEGARSRTLKKIKEVKEQEEKAISHSEHTVFELKQKMARLRKRQMDEINQFQTQIKQLKSQIQFLHDNHAREIEMSELQVADLRKQINTLIYKA